MQFVQLVVDVLDGTRRLELAVDHDVGCLAPDRGGDLAHSLDEPTTARGHLGAEPARGAARDVLGQVPVALDLGQYPQQGEQGSPGLDRELAKRVVDQDGLIDNLVNELVDQVETLLVEGPAMSSDARGSLLTLLRVLPEVERNGDLAEHIARRAARGMGAEMSPRSRGLVERMGEVASTIWREATDVIIDGKFEAAGAIEDIDDELDDLHVSLTAELTSGSMPVPVAVELALLARFYERFGDHCVNLARRQIGRDGAD